MFYAQAAQRTVARRTSIFRLNYIRVTACRTDFRACFEPPWRVLLGLLHGNRIRGISSSTIDDQSKNRDQINAAGYATESDLITDKGDGFHISENQFTRRSSCQFECALPEMRRDHCSV
ncbi:MAG: hypothetical protein DMF72_03580 [Acidobacteria bacterium]|nr:MAG: hypothetical protein DMF72_03580 [Acidobacteriota bacterium]